MVFPTIGKFTFILFLPTLRILAAWKIEFFKNGVVGRERLRSESFPPGREDGGLKTCKPTSRTAPALQTVGIANNAPTTRPKKKPARRAIYSSKALSAKKTELKAGKGWGGKV